MPLYRIPLDAESIIDPKARVEASHLRAGRARVHLGFDCEHLAPVAFDLRSVQVEEAAESERAIDRCCAVQ